MVYKRVRGWTSERSLPVQNYHKLDEDIQLFKDCNGKVLTETRIWWPEMTEDNKGSPELSISDQGWRGLTKSCRNWQRVVRIERDQTWLTRADRGWQEQTNSIKALESKIFKGRKEDKGCQGLTEPGEPLSSISVSPCQSLPLSAIVSRSQLLSALFAFLALPSYW